MANDLCKTKVADLYKTVARFALLHDEDVRGLKVTVKDPYVVSSVHTVGDLPDVGTPAPGSGYDIMVIGVEQDAEPELLYRDELTTLGLDWGYTGQIAYLRNGRDIWVMNEDGTNHRDLTESTDQEAYPWEG